MDSVSGIPTKNSQDQFPPQYRDKWNADQLSIHVVMLHYMCLEMPIKQN